MEASDVSGAPAPEGSSSSSYPPVPESDRVAAVGEEATNEESERQQDEAAKAEAQPEPEPEPEPEAQNTGTTENVAGVAGSEVTGDEVADGNDGEAHEESDES